MPLPAVLFPLSSAHPAEINVADFGVSPEAGDNTLALNHALATCRAPGAHRLLFPKGTYHFRGDVAVERYVFISNNDEGLKRIIFPLTAVKDLIIDGQGSEFVFHGLVNPFILDRAERVTLRNFSIDFVRPFHSEAIILDHPDEGLDVEILDGFPFKIENNILLFTDGTRNDGPRTTVSKVAIYGCKHVLEFDTRKRETAYMARDFPVGGHQGFAAQSLGGRKVRLLGTGLNGVVGNTMVFGPNTRAYPGFVISDCTDITLHQIVIHHAGGMGIIGQRTQNITVDRCQVTPSHGRMLSTTADATHFVNCTGKIDLTHNLFENQMDDATNIHGIYLQIKERTGPAQAVLQIKHHQQRGFDYLKPGTKVELVRGKSMITYGEAVVQTARWINFEVCTVDFASALPLDVRSGDALAEIRDYPAVTIAHNTIRNNRARGMLLNCRGRTVVEDNTFHTPGAAILFEGDSIFWFEQGGVRDCVIRNNLFDNCMFGVWGDAVIDVKAGIREDMETSRYNRNVLIEGNTFRVYDGGTLLNAYCVDGLTWRNNRVERTTAYPARDKPFEAFVIKHCDRVQIETQ